ncbi:MAG: DUF1549 domain-containing protein [Planctomycetaceae bacterium]|nr:DUF1549 domain-containing protein [Planctomycetaceae bacterium]
MIRLAAILMICSSLIGVHHDTFLDAAEPVLHERIDAFVEAQADGPIAKRSDDAEFLRRVYLDLAGRIPSLIETQSFLNDSTTDKRMKVIDSLLDSPEFPKRMSVLFHVMLMERLGEDEGWVKYLHDSFATNKSWRVMAQEMAHPDADDEANRGAAFFLSKRLENYGQNPIDYPGLVRDVGRLFLGVDLQCAQCHDHLFVDDYKQVDYQGLYGFLGTAVLRRDVTFPAVAENLLTKQVDFKSVFVMEDEMTGPRLPGGAEVLIPTFAKGEEYLAPPDKKTRFPGIPRFSPLHELSMQLPEHPSFRRNIANRLWWVMMGRGLVMPLDLHHTDNPATHPELLELVSDELAARDYDMRWFLRELALSATYQRSSELPDGVESIRDTTYQVALEKPLSTEQLLTAMIQATGSGDALSSGGAKDLQERFAQAFANPPREPEVGFAPSVKAALFLLNDDVVLSWLEPSDTNLVGRLSKLIDPAQLGDELYLSVLTRQPSEEELVELMTYLAAHEADRPAAIGRLAWALLASTEFAVNH